MQLVTWNVQWCCGGDGAVNPKRIVEQARQVADFDVLCLQEIAVHYPRLRGNAGHDQVALLRALLPGFQLFFGAAVDEWTQAGERQRFGNLVATRLPVLQVQHHALPYPADAGVRSMPRMCSVVTVSDPALGPFRVMTTHLEYYSRSQRLAQALAVRQLHVQACAQAAAPPQPADDGSPFQRKCHTAEAIVCGDFNLPASEPEYALIQAPFALDPGGGPVAQEASGSGRLWDSWPLLHAGEPQPPTFRLHDGKSAAPIACDFVFVSDGLKPRLRRIWVDLLTQASDHQPVAVELS